MIRAVVLADTHIRRDGRRRLPDDVYRALDTADVVLHAGDLLVGEVLEDLRRFAPVHAVLGNNDVELRGALPEQKVIDLGGLAVAMVHDSGPKAGRARRLRQRFPAAGIVVFGHSHIPWNEVGIDGQLLFNPGSPTERRTQPHRTYGVLELEDGSVISHTVVPVAA